MAKSNHFLSEETASGNGPVMAVMTLVILGALLFVGLSVMEGISDSTALESGDTFYNASASVTSGVEDSFGMSGTLMLIVIATAILGSLIGILVYIR